MQIVYDFFEAFKSKDYKAMQACYHDQASFTDPVFGTISAEQAKAMWAMLLSKSKDLHLDYKILSTQTDAIMVDWVATYTFSSTQRKVRNEVRSILILKDQKILVQKDVFDLWKWSSMALGLSGTLLGWTPYLRSKIKGKAAFGLRKFMENQRP